MVAIVYFPHKMTYYVYARSPSIIFQLQNLRQKAMINDKIFTFYQIGIVVPLTLLSIIEVLQMFQGF